MNRPHYCRCNPRTKGNRVPTEWYCYVHRRFICDNCVADETGSRHVNCVVGKYNDFLSTPKYEWPNKCPLCSDVLPDDSLSVVRLMCKCVYHSKCLREFLIAQPNNNIGCVKCGIPITNQSDSPTKLGRSVSKFLKLVSRDRLFLKSTKPKPNPKFSSAMSQPQQSSSATATAVAKGNGAIKSASLSTSTTAIAAAEEMLNLAAKKDDDYVHRRGSAAPTTTVVVDPQTRQRKTAQSHSRATTTATNTAVQQSAIHSTPNRRNRENQWSPQKIFCAIFIIIAIVVQLALVYILFFRQTSGSSSSDNAMNQAFAEAAKLKRELPNGGNDVMNQILGQNRVRRFQQIN